MYVNWPCTEIRFSPRHTQWRRGSIKVPFPPGKNKKFSHQWGGGFIGSYIIGDVITLMPLMVCRCFWRIKGSGGSRSERAGALSLLMAAFDQKIAFISEKCHFARVIDFLWTRAGKKQCIGLLEWEQIMRPRGNQKCCIRESGWVARAKVIQQIKLFFLYKLTWDCRRADPLGIGCAQPLCISLPKTTPTPARSSFWLLFSVSTFYSIRARPKQLVHTLVRKKFTISELN